MATKKNKPVRKMHAAAPKAIAPIPQQKAVIDHVVIGRFLHFSTGIIRLTPEQARPRMYGLTPVPGRKGWFEVTKQIGFKRGEVIGLDPETVPKISRALVKPIETVEEIVKKVVGEGGDEGVGDQDGGQEDEDGMEANAPAFADPTADGSLS